MRSKIWVPVLQEVAISGVEAATGGGVYGTGLAGAMRGMCREIWEGVGVDALRIVLPHPCWALAPD